MHTVIIYIDTMTKIKYRLKYLADAREYTVHAMREGIKVVDNRGVECWYPASRIRKIKLFPPGIEPETTEKAEVN